MRLDLFTATLTVLGLLMRWPKLTSGKAWWRNTAPASSNQGTANFQLGDI